MHLYELSQSVRTLQVMSDDEENFNPELVKVELAQVKVEFDEKVESIGKLVLNLEVDELALKTEIDRLEQRKKVAKGKIDFWRNYLITEMQNAKQDKVKGQVLNVSLRDNTKPTVNILDASKIPHELCKFIPESYVPDKELILNRTKTTGEVVEGAEVITGKKYVTIK
jgi:hypothetical protein